MQAKGLRRAGRGNGGISSQHHYQQDHATQVVAAAAPVPQAAFTHELVTLPCQLAVQTFMPAACGHAATVDVLAQSSPCCSSTKIAPILSPTACTSAPSGLRTAPSQRELLIAAGAGRQTSCMHACRSWPHCWSAMHCCCMPLLQQAAAASYEGVTSTSHRCHAAAVCPAPAAHAVRVAVCSRQPLQALLWFAPANGCCFTCLANSSTPHGLRNSPSACSFCEQLPRQFAAAICAGPLLYCSSSSSSSSFTTPSSP